MFELKGKVNGIKNFIFDHSGEKRIIKTLEDKGYLITEFRICNASRNNEYVSGVVDSNKKKIFFTSAKIVEIGSTIVDRYLNLYSVIASNQEKNQLLDDNTITTVCSYKTFIPNSPARNVISQEASIDQNFSNNTFSNVGTIVLNVEQKAKIEQSISIYQMVESVEIESKYRFEPLKNITDFLSLANEILKGIKTIDELKNKTVESILKESSSFLKDMIELLIKNLKKKADDTGHYRS